MLRTTQLKWHKKIILFSLTVSRLCTSKLTAYECRCGFRRLVYYRGMIEKVLRIDLIRKAHAVALAEKGNIELEGVLATNKDDVLDEAQHLDALDHVEQVDVDSDENLVDMEAISPAMRAMFAS